MAQLLYQNFSANAVAVTLTTTAETLIITSNAIDVPTGCGFALVLCSFELTVGASVTSLNYRCRRGNLVTGPQINVTLNDSGGIAAGANVVRTIAFVDTLPVEDLAQYSLTIAQAAATGNGATTFQSIAVFLF